MNKKLKYELEEQVVNIILNVLNRAQVSGVQNATNLIAVVKLLQNPLNKEELEKDTFEQLKSKFEPETTKKEGKVPDNK